DPKPPATLYAGTAVGGGVGYTFKSTDGGSSWSWRVWTRWFVGALAVDPSASANVYGGTVDGGLGAGGGIVKSTDYGDSWTWNPSSGLTGFERNVRALAIDPQAPATLYAGIGTSPFDRALGGVYKSTDGGNSWNATGLNNLKNFSALAIDPQTPTTLYASGGSFVGSV